MKPDQSNRSLASLFTELSREISDLVRKEMALARAEVTEKIQQAGTGLASLGAGGMIVLIGLFFLVQALVFGIAALLQLWVSDPTAEWLAPLLVGLVTVLIGWALLAKGRNNLRPANLAPRRTSRSLRHDAQLAKEQL